MMLHNMFMPSVTVLWLEPRSMPQEMMLLRRLRNGINFHVITT